MTKMTTDEKMMSRAIRLAQSAVADGDEPFGSVLTRGDEVVYESKNKIYTMHDPTYHGEAGLIREFCSETGITDLSEYTLYSNCEPCFMCSGAMVWVKLGRLVYGATNKDLEKILGNADGADCAETVFRNSFHRPEVTVGVLREECIKVLEEYFSDHKKG